MLPLYPAIKPYTEQRLDVDNIHTLYIEESGIPDGIPVLFLHGGPGAGIQEDHRRFFDPERYRIILFDQRGAGKSTPHACLEQNTTQLLISDIEQIRKLCNVDKFVLFGGSWGSTLAMLYAQEYPQHVSSMILRGIFLCRDEDISWFYQSGASRIYPDYWDDFISHVPESKRSNNLQAYYDILTSDDEVARMAAAKSWSHWEALCSTLDVNQKVESVFTSRHNALSIARIESHYFMNNIFMPRNSILDNMHKISHIPAIIVHGRYDTVCPLDNALSVHKKWNEAELDIIRLAGHSAFEPAIISALVSATNKMAK